MPLFDYVCVKCSHSQEHFMLSANNLEKKCPSCGADEYIRQMSLFLMNVEYANAQENYDKKIAPSIQDTYRQIGREALNDDTKTLNNIFGNQKVEGALGGR